MSDKIVRPYIRTASSDCFPDTPVSGFLHRAFISSTGKCGNEGVQGHRNDDNGRSRNSQKTHVFATEDGHRYRIKDWFDTQQQRSFHRIDLFYADRKKNICQAVLEDCQDQQPDNILYIPYKGVGKHKRKAYKKRDAITHDRAVLGVAVAVVHQDNLGGVGETGGKGEQVAKDMAELQRVGKGQHTSAKNAESQDDFPGMGTFFSKDS